MSVRRALLPIACAVVVLLPGLTAQGEPILKKGSLPDAAPAPAATVPRPVIDPSFGKLPLQFEVNRGQADPDVRYLTRGGGTTLYIKGNETVWTLTRHEQAAERIDPCDPPAVRELNRLDRRGGMGDPGPVITSTVTMRLEGSRPAPKVEGLDELSGKVNYFIGNDPSKWRTDIPTYEKVRVAGVYEGIDLLFYGNQSKVEYDLVVAPGVDPSVIRIAFEGADRISTDPNGDLVVKTAAGDLRMKAPLVYQEVDGRRVEIAAAYVVRPNQPKVEFRLAAYDKTRPLVIDPVIVWATYFGASTIGGIYLIETSVALAPDGGLIVAGTAHRIGANWDGFVAKLNPSGTAIVYQTILSTPWVEKLHGVAVDATGAVYVTGRGDLGFPTTPYAYQGPAGSTIFATKISATGNSLVYSSVFAGHNYLWDEGVGIAVDAGGAAFITGTTTDPLFPTTPGAFQGPSYIGSTSSGFVAKLLPDGSGFNYATILNGTHSNTILHTEPKAIALNPAGEAFVTGGTTATDFPVSPGAYQSTMLGGTWDTFITRLNSAGTAAVFSTYLGGAGSETAIAIALDAAGAAYVAGDTGSPTPVAIPFPTTPGALLASTGAEGNAGFVTKLAPDGGSLTYSTLWYGPVRGLDLDSQGNAVVVGDASYYGSFPVSPGSPNGVVNGGNDAYLTKFNPSGTDYLFSGLIGGSKIEGASDVVLVGTDAYVTGRTNSLDFATTPGVVHPNWGLPLPAPGQDAPPDGFAVRMHIPLAMTASALNPPSGPSLGGTAVTVDGTGFQPGATVRFGNSAASVDANLPTQLQVTTAPHAPGPVDVLVENPDGGAAILAGAYTYTCASTAPTATLTGTATICAGSPTDLTVTLTGTGPWDVYWSDGFVQNGVAASPAVRTVSPTITTTYSVTAVADTSCGGSCAGTATVTVNPVASTVLTAPASVCPGRTYTASVPSTAGATYGWLVGNGTVVSGFGTNVISFTAGDSGSVSLEVQAQLGTCQTQGNLTIPITTPPAATVTAGAAICAGDSADVAFTLTGAPPFTLTWSDGFVQNVAVAGPGVRTVTPAATTSYAITSVADASGCAGSAAGSGTVTVNPAPLATISGTTDACIAATGLVASVPDAGAGATYAWTITGGTITSGAGTNSITFDAAGAGPVTLGITVTLSTGCSATSSRFVTIAPPPSAAVLGGGTVCAGAPATIEAALAGVGPFNVTWSDGFVQTGVAASPATRTVTPATTTTYSVTAVSDSRCAGTASGSATVTVISSPSAELVAGDQSVCPGGTATLTVNLGGEGPWTLVWSDGFTQVETAGGVATRTVTPYYTTVYQISEVSNGTCTAFAGGSVRVSVFPEPSAAVIASAPSICEGAEGNTASVPDSGAGVTYTWTVTNGTITGGNGTRTITWDAGTAGTTTLHVTVTAAGGCETNGAMQVQVRPRPALPSIHAPSSLISGAGGYVAELAPGVGPGFTWTIQNGTITEGAGTARIVFTAGQVGVLRLTVVERNAVGCDSPTATLELPVTGLTAARFVPIVLDVPGALGPRFSTDLSLANPGPSEVEAEMVFTAATSLGATGSGTVRETLPAGRQLMIPDVLEYLRAKGLAIPRTGSQAGTLRVTFSNLSYGVVPSAVSRTSVASGPGRAGLSMSALRMDDLSAPDVRVFGLRESAKDRSNLALLHAGTGSPIDLKVTLFSGDGPSVAPFVVPDTIHLEPGQWTQLNGVLRQAGFANGWALVRRVAGTEPFHAYGVFNDNVTNDASVVVGVPAVREPATQVVPVVLESGAFTSELVLTNPGEEPATVNLRFVESLANPEGYAFGGVTITLAPRQQKIYANALAELRALGMVFQPAGAAYAGTLFVAFSSGGVSVDGFAGARTSSPASGGGQYGVFCEGRSVARSATTEAWIPGLRQDGQNRSNLAVVNSYTNKGPLTYRYEVYDGATGTKVGDSEPATLQPGAWRQVDGVLKAWGVASGYVRVVKLSGDGGFVAYGVVNDGSVPGAGTSDGSFVEMVTP